MANKRIAVVDGNNVAWEEMTSDEKPRAANLVDVRRVLQEAGYDPIIIVDASLRHQIDDPDQLEALMDEGTIHQAPAGTEADYFVLETADRHDAVVISNDRFDQYQEDHPWIKDRRIPFMIIRGNVQLYEESTAG